MWRRLAAVLGLLLASLEATGLAGQHTDDLPQSVSRRGCAASATGDRCGGSAAKESVLLQLRQPAAAPAAGLLSLDSARADAGSPIQGTLSLDHFRYKKYAQGCFDRQARGNSAVVDAHLHARPRDGGEVPYMDLMRWLRRSGVLFTTVMGIGQRHSEDDWNRLEQSLDNDYYNGLDYQENRATLAVQGPHVMTAMTFPELAEPEDVPRRWKLLESAVPGVFGPMGELNVVKESLFDWGVGLPVPEEKIPEWSWFMGKLRERNLPINLHCDLGNKEKPWKYVGLMDKVLATYRDNKIVWAHLGGVSYFYAPSGDEVDTHIRIIEDRLRLYPKLYIDLAWDILEDYLFSDPTIRSKYVSLINSYPDRFVPGVDIVASSPKTTEKYYREQLAKNSNIYKYLSDEAFRKIALGQNYFNLMSLSGEFRAPQVCAGYSPAPAPGAAQCVDAIGTDTSWGWTCDQLRSYCGDEKSGAEVRKACPQTCEAAVGTGTPWGWSCAQLKGYCTNAEVQGWCPRTCGACR